MRFVLVWAVCCLTSAPIWSQEFMIPHITPVGGNFISVARLSNTGSTEHQVILSGYDSSGTLVTQLATDVPPQLTASFPGDFEQLDPNIAYMTVTGDPDVQLSVGYAANREGAGWANVPATSSENKHWRIFRGNAAVTWDGIAMVNRGYRDATVSFKLKAFTGGGVLGEVTETLTRGQKKVVLLSNMFEAANDSNLVDDANNATIDIESSEPLAVTSLRGDWDSNFLWENKAMAIGSSAPIRQIDLGGELTHPEGIAIHQGTGDIFVGGTGTNDIQVIRDGVASYFKSSGQDGLKGVVGMHVDSERNRLWVCTSALLDAATGLPPNTDPNILPEIVVFDTESGEVLARFGAEADGEVRLFNDVVTAADGRAYLTDGDRIRTVDPELTEMTVFAQDPQFITGGLSLNGIAVTPDQRYLIVVNFQLFAPSANILRLDRVTGAVTDVATDVTFTGGDGILFVDDCRMIIINSQGQMVDFSEDYSKAALSSFPTDVVDTFNFPTTAALYGEKLYVVNSQFQVIAFGGVAELPFTISEVPMSRLK